MYVEVVCRSIPSHVMQKQASIMTDLTSTTLCPRLPFNDLICIAYVEAHSRSQSTYDFLNACRKSSNTDTQVLKPILKS